ncbi:STAS domain-containing protein [Krasilnikovia sp. MM14-A1004]|uniref:STAS domain-containing protein n=1 Tax=Krasilnikovia sp. MM14-A1004 TaxID=3373541 RepID=UPI00399C6E48
MATFQDQPAYRWVGTSDGVLRFVVAGDLDRHVLEQIVAALHAVPPTTGPHVDIDLSAVTFLDAAIAGVLICYHATAAENGGRVTVVNATGIAQRVLSITGPPHLTGIVAVPPPRRPQVCAAGPTTPAGAVPAGSRGVCAAARPTRRVRPPRAPGR